MKYTKLVIIGGVIFGELFLLVFLIPGIVVWLGLIIGGLSALFFLFMARGAQRTRSGEGTRMVNILPVLSGALPIFFGWITMQMGNFSLVVAILTTALTIDFFSNFLALPLSLYHKYLEDKSAGQDVRVLPSVSIIVPAHNEQKTISRCLDSLLEVEYPKKEILVIDDGSDDRTYEIALGYQRNGVKVFHRPKAGGKSMAMNTGILFSSGEIIVTCDADSLISRRAIRNIVKRFADSRVNAVAGNVKVLNVDRLVTKCQALEYIVNENIYRRVFDVFGVVPVVPGPLAAFRRSSLEEVGFYDKDTLTEDFDVTIQILKTGKVVQVMSDAFVYTEYPQRGRISVNRGFAGIGARSRTLSSTAMSSGTHVSVSCTTSRFHTSFSQCCSFPWRPLSPSLL